MKFVLLIFLLIVSTPIFAQDENPTNICAESNQCTKKMESISAGFKNGTSTFSKESLSGFSGSCYHLNPLYDSEHEHHGAFYFERKGNDLFIDGIFSFFSSEDPYQDMTVKELREWFLANNSKASLGVVRDNLVELQFRSEYSDFHYWFRANKSSQKLFLIASQFSSSSNSYVFCEMKRLPK